MAKPQEAGIFQPFPDESSGRRGLTTGTLDYEISYAGKKPVDEILRTRAVSRAEPLVQVGDGSSGNLFFAEENLAVLHHLLQLPTVRGQIRVVYIDPPFGTQQRFKSHSRKDAYSDELGGSAYLEFLRERLILLRELIAADGSIYVHLDNAMASTVKGLMDEIFGPQNFRNWITRKKCNAKNYTARQYGNMQDYILFYSKGKRPVWNRPLEPSRIYSLEQRFPKVEIETGRRYALVPIHAKGRRNGSSGQPWRGLIPPEGKHWQYSLKTLDDLDAQGRIYWSPTGNPRKKIYSDESDGIPVQDIWLDFKDAHNQNIAITGYPSEKNVDLLKRIVEASSNEGDLVLDCFAGSGTTLLAAEQLGRCWIGADNSGLAQLITMRRLLESEHTSPLWRRLKFELFADPAAENQYRPDELCQLDQEADRIKIVTRRDGSRIGLVLISQRLPGSPAALVDWVVPSKEWDGLIELPALPSSASWELLILDEDGRRQLTAAGART